MKTFVLTLAALLVSAGNMYAANFAGPFRAEALAFYLVHKGGPLKVSLNVKADKNKSGKVVCRFFDVGEELVKWDYGKIKAGESIVYSKDYGSNAPSGIYQVRYSGKNIEVGLKADPESSYGIMPLRCMLQASSNDQFKNAWFYIPQGYEKFSVKGYGTKGNIYNDSQKSVAIISGKSTEIDIKEKSGQVWSLSLKMRPQPYYRFGVSGMPLILCPDKRTAMTIAGSVEKTSDGKFFPHKFQVKMYEWIKSLKRSDLELDIVNLRDKVKLEKDKYSGALFGAWGFLDYLPYTLKFQDIDPDSETFGEGGNPTSLAVAYSMNKPWNPYFRNPVIEKRLLLAQFQRLLKLKENDSLENSDNSYCGTDALTFLQFPSSSFYFAGKDIQDKKLAKLWAGAVRRIPDRFSMFRISCENQSSHWPVAYKYMVPGTGEKGYLELAEDYISGLSKPENNEFMKTGYQQEAYGPDATYQGLGACYQALYYRMTGNDTAKQGLDIIYNFFNHTVAPEPDGKKVYGASNFAHRTAGSWTGPQYGAGRQFMKGELESAAVWFRNIDDIDYLQKLEKGLKKPVKVLNKSKRNQTVSNYSTSIIGPFYSEYLYPSKKIPDAKFPVEKQDEFTRNFNDEFICVRRPAYYSMVYMGASASKWTRKKVRFNPKSKNPIYKWNQTQGMGMMWTPNYGNCILGMNWNADTAQMIRADIGDDICDFPDYWSLKKNFDLDSMTLLMDWKMFKLPVEIRRKITFNEKSVSVKVRLHFPDSCKVQGLYEQLPFVKKAGAKIEFMKDGKWQAVICPTDEFRFINSNGAGIRFKFKKNMDFMFGKETRGHWNKDQLMGVLKVKLGNSFKKGELARVQYEMIPF